MNELVVKPKFKLNQLVYYVGSFSSDSEDCNECNQEGVIQVLLPTSGKKHSMDCPKCKGKGSIIRNFKDTQRTRIKKIHVTIDEDGIEYEYKLRNLSFCLSENDIYENIKLAKQVLDRTKETEDNIR